MPETGIEPVRPISGKRRILSPLCLPISPFGQVLSIVAKKGHNPWHMKEFSFRLILLGLIGLGLISGTGCASHSTQMARQLDRNQAAYESRACQQTLGEVWIHQDIKNVATFATPVVALAAGPVSALPLLLTHVGLGAADRMDAATLARRCGAPPPGVIEIGAGIATDAALGVIGGNAGSALGKSLPSTAVPASGR